MNRCYPVAGYPVHIITRDNNPVIKGCFFDYRQAVIIRDLPTHSKLPKFLEPDEEMPAIEIKLFFKGYNLFYCAVPATGFACYSYGGLYIDSNNPCFKQAFKNPIPLFDRPLLTPNPIKGQRNV